MSVTAKGPPYVASLDDWWDLSPEEKAARDLAKVPGAYDSTAFGQAGKFDDPVVHKPIIPEVEERDSIFPELYESVKQMGEITRGEREPSRVTQVGGTHYSDLSIQPWDAMRAWMSPAEYIGYHVGTIIGYLSRHKAKGGEQDLQKAGHHMDELRRYLKEDEEYPW